MEVEANMLETRGKRRHDRFHAKPLPVTCDGLLNNRLPEVS